jgi:hypothetical protein
MADEYWFCLKHHTVEGAEGCKAADRLGPYPTAEEAGRALEKVAQRNEAWESDPDWNDDVPERE